MRFFNTLSALAALSILFASQSQALDVRFITATCSSFEFSVEVSPSDFQLADFATFYVANAAAVNTDNAKVSYTIQAGGDIYQSNRIFNFSPRFTDTPPGGTQWRLGVALNGPDGKALTYSGAEQFTYITNPCSSSSSSTSRSSSATMPASTSTYTYSSTSSSSTPSAGQITGGANSTSPVTPTPTTKPKPISITAIAGGIAGAVALLVALGVFLCLRKRKASQKAAIQRQNGSGDVIEKGFVSHDPIHSINTLPRSGHDSNLSDFISKDETMSNRTSFVPPPMSPRSSQWNTSNVGPMSPSSAPLSPTLSATSVPSRANNPLLNNNFGSWTATPNNNNVSSQDNQFGDLPEPMSRR